VLPQQKPLTAGFGLTTQKDKPTSTNQEVTKFNDILRKKAFQKLVQQGSSISISHKQNWMDDFHSLDKK
jgi:hypothetical protein